MALKQDNLLKEWMSREKAAVDYARTCDKRIAQLVAEADELKGQLPAQMAEQARTYDKRIAQLVAEADELKGQLLAQMAEQARTYDKRIAQLVAEADELKRQLRAQMAEQARKPALERQLEATTALVKSMTAEIDRLQAQLVKARALYKTPPKPSNANLPRLTKLQAVVDIAKAGLAEELRIMRKPEPALQETILISEGEDLIPPRWLPLKTALQSLQGISPEGKKPRH